MSLYEVGDTSALPPIEESFPNVLGTITNIINTMDPDDDNQDTYYGHIQEIEGIEMFDTAMYADPAMAGGRGMDGEELPEYTSDYDVVVYI